MAKIRTGWHSGQVEITFCSKQRSLLMETSEWGLRRKKEERRNLYCLSHDPTLHKRLEVRPIGYRLREMA